jgi:hypothetical protein
MSFQEDLQTLRLLKAFSKIADPAARREIIALAEARVLAPKEDTKQESPEDGASVPRS